MFPKWKYHPHREARIVQNETEEQILGFGWKDKPCGNTPSKEASIAISASALTDKRPMRFTVRNAIDAFGTLGTLSKKAADESLRRMNGMLDEWNRQPLNPGGLSLQVLKTLDKNFAEVTKVNAYYGSQFTPRPDQAVTLRGVSNPKQRFRDAEPTPPSLPTFASLVTPCDNEPVIFSSLNLISGTQR